MRFGLCLRAGLVGAAAALAVGCGGRGDVTGTVTYKGKPVVTGSVTFYGADKEPHVGAIDEQGNYRVTDVPSGPCRVAVASPDPAGNEVGGKSGKPTNPNDPPAPAAKASRPAGWQPVPTHFGDAQSSKLGFDVRSGPNTIPITLE